MVSKYFEDLQPLIKQNDASTLPSHHHGKRRNKCLPMIVDHINQPGAYGFPYEVPNVTPVTLSWFRLKYNFLKAYYPLLFPEKNFNLSLVEYYGYMFKDVDPSIHDEFVTANQTQRFDSIYTEQAIIDNNLTNPLSNDLFTPSEARNFFAYRYVSIFENIPPPTILPNNDHLKRLDSCLIPPTNIAKPINIGWFFQEYETIPDISSMTMSSRPARMVRFMRTPAYHNMETQARLDTFKSLAATVKDEINPFYTPPYK